jgi:hypothetical protein
MIIQIALTIREVAPTPLNSSAFRQMTIVHFLTRPLVIEAVPTRNDNVDIELSRDSNGGYSVGWISAGEYLTYTLDIPETGIYQLDARVASASGGSHRFRVSVDGQQAEFGLESTGGWLFLANDFGKPNRCSRGR